jgi:hypothetical protein
MSSPLTVWATEPRSTGFSSGSISMYVTPQETNIKVIKQTLYSNNLYVQPSEAMNKHKQEDKSQVQ